MFRPARLRLAALGLLVLHGTASATAVVHMDTRALVHRSADIVVGEVTGLRSYWSPDRRHVFTDVSVRVSEALKGGAGASLTLTQIGGEVDGFRYSVDGAPRFAVGEEALLFVWRDAAGRAQVSGLSQGKFEIRRDPASGERLISRALPGLAVRDVKTLAASRAGEAGARITLDAMRREIQSALAEDGR